MDEAYKQEVDRADLALRQGDAETAFSQLERAQVPAQTMTGRHIVIHWRMRVAGLRRGDQREVVGQVPRIVAAILFSRLWVPLGRTGRARVSALKPRPVLEDLRALFARIDASGGSDVIAAPGLTEKRLNSPSGLTENRSSRTRRKTPLRRARVLMMTALATFCAMTVNAQSLNLASTQLPQADGGSTTLFYPTGAAESPITKGPFRLSWASDAQPKTGNGRLVVISHGSGGSPWVHVDLARVLVARGFVVAIPQHAGDNYLDPSSPGPESWVKRPLEVSSAIDRIANDPRLASILSLDAVGVFGGSAGGHTALSLAGGEWSPARFRDHCMQHIEEDFSSCVGFTTMRHGDWLDGVKVWLAKRVIAARFSDSTVHRHVDPRIKASVAMVPFAADFDPQSLVKPAIALGLVVAARDVNQIPAFHVEAVQKVCEPRCQLIMHLQEAGHGAMLSPLPPLDKGSIAEHLLSDPAAFDRADVLPRLNEKIAVFFEKALLVP